MEQPTIEVLARFLDASTLLHSLVDLAIARHSDLVGCDAAVALARGYRRGALAGKPSGARSFGEAPLGGDATPGQFSFVPQDKSPMNRAKTGRKDAHLSDGQVIDTGRVAIDARWAPKMSS